MSAHQITSMLARLPYTDMKNLAAAIADRIGIGSQSDAVAGALVSLVDQKALTESEGYEQEIMKRIFSRKRTITIQRKGKEGLVISCPSLHNINVVTTDVRKGLADLLDQLAALSALQDDRGYDPQMDLFGKK